jgi:hypothetical protein
MISFTNNFETNCLTFTDQIFRSENIPPKNFITQNVLKIILSLVVSTSRQIEIEIENVLSVETNF